MVVASPSYLAANSTPVHPRELVNHKCIGWRQSPDVAPYRWPFEENRRAFDLAIEPQITTNDLRLMYFPQRRNIAPKLRALIDHVKEWRQQLA